MIGSLIGGTAALLGEGPANIAAGITSSLPGFAGLIVIVVWMLTVQALLPFAVGYAAGMCAVSHHRPSAREGRWRWSRWSGSWPLAIVLQPDSVAALELPLGDRRGGRRRLPYRLLRRQAEDLPHRPALRQEAAYGVLNPWGWLAVAVGVAGSLLVHPVGPEAMVEWIEGLAIRAPLADLALPGLATAMVLAGLVYWILGAMLVREEVVVSRVRL